MKPFCGTSDRTVICYFPTKDDLVTSVLVVMGERLQDVLAGSFAAPAADHVSLVAAVWPALARPGMDRLLGLYFEAIGQAAAGLQPYRALASQLVEGRIGWLADNVVGDPDVQRAEAVTALAMLDGLLLMRQLAGPAAADLAAARLLR